MEDVISELKQRNESIPVPLELPDMDDIVEVEQQLLLSVGVEFRQFLLSVSDVVCGTLEPGTVIDPQSHTYLPEVAATAWSLGVPRDLVPLCEHNNNYYCVDELGEVVYWQQGEISDETWPGVWEWAQQIWLNS